MKSQHLIGNGTPKQDQMTDTQDNVTDNHTIHGLCQIQIQMLIQIYTCKYIQMKIDKQFQIQYKYSITALIVPTILLSITIPLYLCV